MEQFDNDRVAVIIASRNEKYLPVTVDKVLERARGDIEVIAVMDGEGSEVILAQEKKGTPEYDPRVKVIRLKKSIGQRAAVNLGARSTDAKYFLKTDAHSLFDEGFDVKLKADCKYDWTVIPRLYNLDGAEIIYSCPDCDYIFGSNSDLPPDKVFDPPKNQEYSCPNCKKNVLVKDSVQKPNEHFFQPKWKKITDFMFIGSVHDREPQHEMRAWYWQNRYRENKGWGRRGRDWAEGDICDMMTAQGACWFMHRQRFLDQGGLDERHGGWGQVGVEVACKAWLSGGRHVINKKTWFSHWFRKHMGGFTYHLSGRDVDIARAHCRDLWVNNKWEGQVRPFSWLVRKFWPVPTWADADLADIESRPGSRAIIYYTDNSLEDELAKSVRKNLREASGGIPIVSVTQKPLKFGDKKVCVGEIGRSHLSMYKQILAGLENTPASIIYLAEHDCLYPPEHFQFIPEDFDKFYYNNHLWVTYLKKGLFGRAKRKTLSGLVSYKKPLIDNIRARIKYLESGKEIPRGIRGACEPGVYDKKWFGETMGGYETFETKAPILDIDHGDNFTRKPLGVHSTDRLPYWGTVATAIEGLAYKVRKDKWYQNFTIEGWEAPSAGPNCKNSKCWNIGRWENYIKPILPFDDFKDRRFVEIGCNAGMYLLEAAKVGFSRIAGIESDLKCFDQARYVLALNNYANIKLINQAVDENFSLEDLPVADLTLMSNVHYWIEPGALKKYVDGLAEKSLYCLLVSRAEENSRYASPANKKAAIKLFGDKWEYVKGINEGDVDLSGDPVPRKMYSLLFKSKILDEYLMGKQFIIAERD